MGFVNQLSYYSSLEEFETARDRYMNHLSELSKNSLEELSSEEKFVLQWIRSQKTTIISLVNHRSRTESELWQQYKKFELWSENTDCDDVERHVQFLAMRERQNDTKMKLAREEIELYDEWVITTTQTDFTKPVDSKEMKKFYKRCGSDGIEEFIHFKTLNAPCGCILWEEGPIRSYKGESIPYMYRETGKKGRTRGNPIQLLCCEFRGIQRGMRTYDLKKNCIEPFCINPFHYEFIKKGKRKRS